MDSETDLIYMQGRYYDPATTRFISRDPENVIPGDNFSTNRYVYVNGNPLAHTDPSGRCIEDLCIAEGAAACAATPPCAAAVVGGLATALSYFGVKAVQNTRHMVDPSHSDVVEPNPTPSQEAVDKIKGDTTPADGQAGKDGVRVGAGGAAGAAAAIDIVKGVSGSTVLVESDKVTVVALPDGRKVESHTSTKGGQYAGDRTIKIQDKDGKVTPDNIIWYPEPASK